MFLNSLAKDTAVWPGQMSAVSSAYLTRIESFPAAALKSEEYTVYSTGPMPDPYTILCVIVRFIGDFTI